MNYQLAGPVLYLLDVVLPSVTPQTLRSNYSRTVPTLIAVLDALSLMSDNVSEGTAAIIRSALGAVESLVLAQDFSSWKSDNERGVQAVFTTYLLGSGMDHRPKVRKRALEAIEKILTNPPAHPSATHPAADDTAAICFHTVQAQFSQSKKNKNSTIQIGPV